MSSSALERRSGMWKWWICLILFLATVLNYFDRNTMSMLIGKGYQKSDIPEIEVLADGTTKVSPAEQGREHTISYDFQLSNEDYGQIQRAFRWPYALAQVFGGWVADRYSIRWVYAFSVGLWSFAGAAAAFTWGKSSLAMTRALLGVGEAFNWPCALRVVGNMLPARDRALGIGFFSSGSSFATATAPMIIVGLMALFHNSWRAVFLVMGALGIVWIALWWYATRDASALESDDVAAGEEAPKADAATRVSLGDQILQMVSHPGFWVLVVISMTINPCFYFLADWVPKYLIDVREFSLEGTGLLVTPIMIGGLIGNFIGGAVMKYLSTRGWAVIAARNLATAVSVALILPAASVGWIEDPYLAVVVLTIAAMGVTSTEAIYMACIQDVSFLSVGLISGVLGGVGNIVGAEVNPVIGRYVDTHGHFNMVFVVLAIAPVVSAVAIIVFGSIVTRWQRRALSAA